MNQGKLDVLKQEIARVNINISWISELKWTGMGEFNSDDYYIYYWGQDSLRRNGVALIINKWVWNAVLEYNFKNDRLISARFQGKPFNTTVIQVYAQTTNTEEDEVELSWEDLQDILELTPKKDVFFIIEDWNAKVRSREIPGLAGKFDLGVQNEAGQRLTKFYQNNALVTLSSNNTRDNSTNGHHQMVSTKIRLIIFLAVKDGEALTVSRNKTWSWLWLRSSAPFCKIQAQIEESGENH